MYNDFIKSYRHDCVIHTHTHINIKKIIRKVIRQQAMHESSPTLLTPKLQVRRQ